MKGGGDPPLNSQRDPPLDSLREPPLQSQTIKHIKGSFPKCSNYIAGLQGGVVHNIVE